MTDPAQAPRRSSRKAVTVPVALTVTFVAAIVCCVMPTVLALTVPWRYWWDIPKVTITACSIDERSQVGGSFGSAMADFKITNWSWQDREYVVTLVAKDDAGAVVGTNSHGYSVALPARSSMESHGHSIPLVRQGAKTCEVGEAKLKTG